MREKGSFSKICAFFALVWFLLPGVSVFAGNFSDIEIEIDEDDRCPVCAMRVALYPTFAAAMELRDGKAFKFCSNGCMIRSWLRPKDFLGVERQEIERVWVQDYFTGRRIDGTEAVWVWGSDVRGPMGPTPVPLVSEKDFEAFNRRHGGKTVFHLRELTEEKWENITGRKASDEKGKARQEETGNRR